MMRGRKPLNQFSGQLSFHIVQLKDNFKTMASASTFWEKEVNLGIFSGLGCSGNKGAASRR